MTGVNTLFNALLNNKSFNSWIFLRCILSAGGGMPVQNDRCGTLGKLTGPIPAGRHGLTGAPAGERQRMIFDYHSGSIGLPVPSTEAKLVDDDDNEVAG